MDERTLRALEFDKICHRLSELTQTSMGREQAMALQPLTQRFAIEKRQEETQEATTALRLHTLALRGVSDIRLAVKRAVRGAVLSIEDLSNVRSTLESSRRLKRQLLHLEGLPLLSDWGERLLTLPEVEEEIRHCLTEDLEVADAASAELMRVRRQLRSLRVRIKERIESMSRSQNIMRYLQEPLVTIRNDRYVLPVKQEYRAQVKGLVHDQSSSGATLFIEPLALVDLGNDVKRLELEENRAVERVLQKLSALVQQAGDELVYLVDDLGTIDFVLARGALAHEHDASAPQFGDDGHMDLFSARHPLLGRSAVPVDLRLGVDGKDALVITGPNTGGKTVTLKTAGLLVLMAQSGLHIPAAPRSRLPVYGRLFCDVGDEQSIEQSLSTFSSHMSNIVRFLQAADGQTLVLLDELGAGTDPAEGSALGIAILEFILGRGAQVIATTHYGELKRFAFEHPAVENASVEFDPETLRPTYRLLLGLPGRSNAFAVAEQLGLDESVIARARQLRPAGEQEMEDMLAQLHQDGYRAQAARRESESTLSRLHKQEEELSRERKELARRRRDIMAEARREAKVLVSRARQELSNLIKEARENAESLDTQTLSHRTKQRLEAVRSQFEQPGEGDDAVKAPTKATPEEIRIGDRVKVLSLDLCGEVLEEADASDGDIQVQLGIMKVRVPLSDVVKQEQASQKRPRSSVSQLLQNKAASIAPELDVRGALVEEALERVDKYLDDAIMSGVKQVRIIHGKGSGALRKAVGDTLRQHPHVRGVEWALPAEGGDGVTIAILED